MEEKRIQVYDSLGDNGDKHLHNMYRYLKDEHLDKKKTELPGIGDWQLITTTKETPRQKNSKCYLCWLSQNVFACQAVWLTLKDPVSTKPGYDCGVFTCMFAEFLSKDYPLSFKQEDFADVLKYEEILKVN